jgi:cytochrome P450
MTISEITWKSGASSAPLPPLVPGLPLLGNALDLVGDMLKFLNREYQKHGAIFRIRAGTETYTAIAGAEANLFFSREHGEHLSSKEFWAALDKQMKADISIISADGEVHSELRQMSKRGYSRSLYESHFADVIEITRKKIDEWPIGESRSVFPWMQTVVIEQLGKVIVGTSPGDYGKDIYNLIRTNLLVLVTRQRPGIFLHTPGYKESYRRSVELSNRILAYHKANPPVDREPNLIDDMLTAVETGNILKEADLVPMALGPYIAGLDTSSSTLSFLLYAIYKHPELLSSIFEESAQLFRQGLPTPSDLRAIDILHRTTIEALRRYPVAPVTQRTVIAPFEFGGYRVDAGTRLFIGTGVAHFDERYHPEPYRFDIDRYLPPRNEHRLPGAYAPFGLGTHTCLGAGLAEAQIMLTAACLFHFGRFEMDPVDYELKIRPLPTNAPANSFRLKRVA